MSYEDITFRYTLQIVNGFVQPANDQKRISTRVTVADALSAIPDSRVVDLRTNQVYEANHITEWNLFNDHLVFQFPEIQGNSAYGTNEDYHEVVRQLGLA